MCIGAIFQEIGRRVEAFTAGSITKGYAIIYLQVYALCAAGENRSTVAEGMPEQAKVAAAVRVEKLFSKSVAESVVCSI